MTVPLRFVLPWPPASSNHMYLTRPNGARHLTPAAEGWFNECIAKMRDGGAPAVPAGWLRFRLDIYPPDARRRDASNLVKLTEDSLAAALGFDDYRISCIEIRRWPVEKGNARLEVELAEDPIQHGELPKWAT